VVTFISVVKRYIETLEKNNIGISITTNHDPYETSVAERVN